MRKRLNELAKLTLLIAALPILIAHTEPSMDGKTSNYTISGGPDPATPISSDNPIRIDVHHQTLLVVEGLENPIPPFTFARDYLTEEPALPVKVISNGPVAGSVGPLWLHRNDETSIKLMDTALTGVSPDYFFQTEFEVDVANAATTPQSVTGPTGAAYILSGSSDSATPLEWTGNLIITLNGADLFAPPVIDTNDARSTNPIAFNASPADILTVEVNVPATDPPLGSLSEVWLHSPSGEARKLVHRTSSYFDGTYRGLHGDFTIP